MNTNASAGVLPEDIRVRFTVSPDCVAVTRRNRFVPYRYGQSRPDLRPAVMSESDNW